MQKQKSAQDIQDGIFRKMTTYETLKLGLDFMGYGLKRGFAEGIPIPMPYLKRWLKKNMSPSHPALKLLS